MKDTLALLSGTQRSLAFPVAYALRYLCDLDRCFSDRPEPAGGAVFRWGNLPSRPANACLPCAWARSFFLNGGLFSSSFAAGEHDLCRRGLHTGRLDHRAAGNSAE